MHNGSYTFTGAIDCEAELAYCLDSSGPDIIAVSKQCCPVCWDYLDYISHKKHGRHNLLFPIELPARTSSAQMDAMLTKYSAVLLANLVRLENLPGRSNQIEQRPRAMSISSAITCTSHKSEDGEKTIANF